MADTASDPTFRRTGIGGSDAPIVGSSGQRVAIAAKHNARGFVDGADAGRSSGSVLSPQDGGAEERTDREKAQRKVQGLVMRHHVSCVVPETERGNVYI